MIYWDKCNFDDIEKCTYSDNKIKYDNNIYTFDIETTSIFYYQDIAYNFFEIADIAKKNKIKISDFINKNCLKLSYMYIWQFSINKQVYYGRTWEEFTIFLKNLNRVVAERKIVYVHNLAFEFSYLQSILTFSKIFARKPLHPIFAINDTYNIEFRCSYMLTNSSLENLTDNFHLDIKKKSGDLDYSKIRTHETKLTKKELLYCEYDCLVLYELIKKFKIEYKKISKIPYTSTGRVRKRFKKIVYADKNYKDKIKKAYNKNPRVYQMLMDALYGGYTHANFKYIGEILESVDSWDYTSSYPYCMCVEKFPCTKFLETKLKNKMHVDEDKAYLIDVTFTNIKSKYQNHIMSINKCIECVGNDNDNGRIARAKKVRLVCTEIDYNLFIKAYNIKENQITINKVRYAEKNYLPRQFVNFILEIYEEKTKLKDVAGREDEYLLYKQLLNSLFGMCLTNTIRDNVYFDENNEWHCDKLSNKEIIKKLEDESKKAFLSPAWGVWILAYARRNIINAILHYDKYALYSDTDSIKLKKGYDMTYILKYNEEVIKKLKYISKIRNIPYDKFSPKDIEGKEHPLGVFDHDGHYEKFVTLGAKKYCVQYIEKKTHKRKIEMTVAGLPKKCKIKSVKHFKIDKVWNEYSSNKNLIEFHKKYGEIVITDYKGSKAKVNIISGSCVYPTSHTLKLGEGLTDYLLSSERAKYIDNTVLMCNN